MMQITELQPVERRQRRAEGRIAQLKQILGDELEQLTIEPPLRIAGEEGRNGNGTEHHTALEQQRVQDRIRLLGQLIAGLPMVEPEAIRDDRAGYGSVVRLRDLDRGRDVCFTLMAGELVDIDADQVSMASPIGQALLGCRPGDEAVVETPQGRRRFRVIGLQTLPQSLGLAGPITPDAA